MRLGQLARKYDIPVQDIIDYLEEQTGEKFHPNAKLYDTMEAKVFDHFDLSEEEVEPQITIDEEEAHVQEVEAQSEDKPQPQEVELPATPEEEIAMVEGELATAEEQSVEQHRIEKLESTLIQHETDHSKPTEDEVIQTDKLLELLESEEANTDLDKIKLIKAPKKELSGLKVVGKVDLPEPKKKEEKPKEIVTERDLREYRNPRKKRQPLTEEEKEKRRLKAKRKKEAYEARQEKRRKEQEEHKKRARKEAHYKQKLEQVKVAQAKQKAKQQYQPEEKNQENMRPEPKTLLGKFWRWMNT